MKCKYCGCSNAEYYNELINTHYCHNCSKIAREEWLTFICGLADYVDSLDAEETEENS